MKKSSVLKSLLVLFITSLAVAPSFALGDDNRNLFLIGVMCISPVILVLLGKWKFNYADIILLIFIGSIILSPLLNHPESLRWTTVFYSIMFCLTFYAYNQVLQRKHFSVKNYQTLLKVLIYAYFFTLLIQQLCVLTGLPIVNESNYRLANPWKLNALAAEPSHTARIVALLMYCYLFSLTISRGRKYSFSLDFKRDKLVWASFFWVMLSIRSGTALVFMPFILLMVLRPRNVVVVMLGSVLSFVVIGGVGSDALERAISVLLATLTLDPNTVLSADHSAGIRIAPTLILAKLVNFTSINGLFGHGIDSVSHFMSDYVYGVKEGLTGGGLLRIWYEYGFVSFLAFVVFSFTKCYTGKSYTTILFWLFIIFLSGINSQIVWLCIILLSTNQFFVKEKWNGDKKSLWWYADRVDAFESERAPPQPK